MRSPQFTIAFAAALALTASATAAETAKYRLDIDVTWSAETHPYDFFPNAHLTRLIGATHNSRYVLFGDGRTASSGLQSVAERGHTEIISAELEDAKERERLDGIFEAEGFGVPAKISVTFAANEEHGFVSFATMIAPSPDWFTGAASVELFKDGAWVDSAEVVLWPWDAGTDGGTTWTAENLETQPHESIRLLTAPHFFGPDGLKPLGTATFVRIE
jgi:hypothetical protein